jgi:tetratricopeptide (TPR) repeat protein
MSEQILSALRKGDFSTALTLANALVETSPGYSDPHYLQALALQSSGHPEQALAAIDRAIALAPDRSDYAMTKALMQIGGKDFVESQSGLMDALALNPNHLEAYVALLHIALAQKNLGEARRLLKLAERVNPDSDSVLVSKGAIANAEGLHDEAQKWYSLAAEQNPDNVMALANLGVLHLKRNMPAFAEQALNRAKALAPANTAVLRGLVQAHLDQNQPVEAEQAVSDLLVLLPSDRAGLGLRADLRRARGDFEGAVQDATALLATKPDDLAVLNHYATVLMQAGKEESAHTALERALTTNPDEDGIWQLLGLVQARLTGDGKAVIDRWLAQRPDSPMAQEALAVYLEATGDLAGAEIAADKALQISEAFAMAQFVKLRQELRSGNPAAALLRAQALATRATTAESQRMILGWLGLIHDRLGEYPQAAQTFSQMATYALNQKPMPALRAAHAVPEGGPSAGFLLWAPTGARIERVLNALYPVLHERLLADRNAPSPARLDGFGWFRPTPGTENAGSALSWQSGIAALGLDPARCVDWLPQWDEYTGAALSGTHFTALLIDPRDALLNWMVFGSAQAYQFPQAPEVAARWLSETFAAVANRIDADPETASAVRIDAIDTESETIAMQLQQALPLDAQPSAEVLATPILALGGMPNQFPAGHWRNYRDVLAAAFATLTPVAERLGYPRD